MECIKVGYRRTHPSVGRAACLLCSLIVLLLSLTGSAAAETPAGLDLATVVRLDPAEANVARTINVTVRVDTVIEMYGFQYRLTFDPDILQVMDADPTVNGVQIQAGDVFRGRESYALNTVDNVTGVITHTATLLSGDAFTGSSTLARITFQAKDVGTSEVEFDSELSRLQRDPRVGGTITATWQGATLSPTADYVQLYLPLVMKTVLGGLQ